MAEIVGTMFAAHVSPSFDGFEEVKISMLNRQDEEEDEHDSSSSSSSRHSPSGSVSSASSVSSYGHFQQGHKRQTSHPPPFQTYHDEEESPASEGRNPYFSNGFVPPNYTVLPAFGSPRLYSARLHRLMESRDRPLYLYLDKEEIDFNEKQNLEDIYLEGKSTYDDSDAGLLPQLPCDEESQCYEKPQRRVNRRRFPTCADSEKEISWVTFAGIAAVLFVIVCSCSFLVAWMAGLFAEGGGLMSHMHIGSNTGVLPPALNEAAWSDDYRTALNEALLKEGYVAGAEMTAEELATFQQNTALWPEKKVRIRTKRRGKLN